MQQFKKSRSKLIFFNSNCEVKMQIGEEAMRLQLEKQFYKMNRFFLIIFEIFLSAPLGIHRPRKSIQTGNMLLYRLHAVLCLIVYALFAFCVYDEYWATKIQLPYVHKTLYFAECWIYLIQLLELMRIINFCREEFWKFYTFILDFDCNLINMKIRITYGDLRRFLLRHLALILLHCNACVLAGYLCRDCKINIPRFNIVYVLPNIVIHILLLQYYALLFIVYRRGQELYIALEGLLNRTTSDDIWNVRHQLNLIRSLFAKLDQFSKTINDHFSISICLIYLGSFINISVILYLLYKYLNTWHRSNLPWIAYSVVWIGMHVGKMLLILYYNQKVQNMKNKATILLSSFKFEYQGAETTLSRFILQLLSDTRSNYVCGILVLNMNFITSLLVAISTLLIYLVQYDITYEALTSDRNYGIPISHHK